MKRFYLWFSLVVLLAMGFGSHYTPDGSFFWLASSDLGAQALRIFLAMIVLVQLFTDPPRHLAVRALTGVVALTTALWALHVSTFMNTPIFDTVVLLQTAVALAIAALERPVDLPQVARSIPLHIVPIRKM